MSNQRTYRVELPGAYVDVKGTGFHLSGGHLVIEDGNGYAAAYPPAQWLAVQEVITEPKTVTIPDGLTVEEVIRGMDRMNERRNTTKEN